MEPPAQFELEGFGEDLENLSPQHVIRTETVLCKLPVHNLAKRGKVDIRILRKSRGGEVDLKWEVSYSDRYGQPRQLAYKLDTIVINKRIDEVSRPLPALIRIGSLKEICRTLGVQENGKNLRDLRTAFLQNASAFIRAQFTYRSASGLERRLEAGFTRYGVIFTGEKLPDGRQADAVYIALNQPYWEVVNEAPFRPLDYDYLKALNPAAQRFYEILSFRVFAALHNGRPAARIAYSDYCAFSAQQRYHDYEHFRVQMYKVHRPHLQSGYLKRVVVQAGVDGEGNPDWLLTYTPGVKARAEYQAFGRKNSERARPVEVIAPEVQRWIAALVDRGITESRARRLMTAVGAEQPVLEQIEWGDYLLSRRKGGSFYNPPGFYFALVRDDIRPPAAFQSKAARQRQTLQEAQRAAGVLEARVRYDAYRKQETEKAFAALPAEETEAAIAGKLRDYQRRFPSLPQETLREIAGQAIRHDIAEGLTLLSFDVFRSASTEGT